MKNIPFVFHTTQMVVRVTTEETQGRYAVLEMAHQPSVGPSLHTHPHGPESFLVLEGSYTFFYDDTEQTLHSGQAVTVTANTPHRYLVGPTSGKLLVICPPNLEDYFWKVAQRLQTGALSLEEEASIAAQYGQDFLELTGHWGHR